jgi:hypothetical protein
MKISPETRTNTPLNGFLAHYAHYYKTVRQLLSFFDNLTRCRPSVKNVPAMADYPSSAGKKIGHSFFHLVSSAIIS